MNHLITSICCLFLCVLVYCPDSEAQTVQERPNIIFFATDDLNTWINPLGYNQAKTPNLDRLSEMGITFTNAHAPAVYCAPSRSAIFSGLHASTTGCYNDEIYFYDNPELVSLQTAFSQAGYKAYGAGKTYHHRAGSIDMRGWEAYFSRSQEIRNVGYEMGYYGSDVPYPDPYPYSPYYTETTREITGGAFLEWGPIAESLAEQIPDAVRTNWVCDLLKEDHSDPFFIALGLYSPHFPNYAPRKFFDMYDREQIVVPDLKVDDLDDLPEYIRKIMTNRSKIQEELESLDAVKDAVMGYLAAVSFADSMLGRVLDALEESAYKDNTVVIFWSDQGYHHGEKGQWGKHTLWEETSHVPLIVAGNGLPQNQTVNTTVSLIDLYPTLIELCNLPQQPKLDGVSLMPTLKNPATAEDRNVLMPYMERGGYAVINSDWRYIHYQDGSEELYNLVNDSNEWNNLASEDSCRSIIDEMKQAAPAAFQPSATPRNSLKLIIEEDSYRWEPKDGSKPAEMVGASITFTNPVSENGISFVSTVHQNNDAYTEQQRIDNTDCRFIPTNSYCYLRVDDGLFRSDHNDITLDITYFDSSNNNFELQYNSRESVGKSLVFAKTNTGQWLTKKIMLADAAFNNQLNNQADFRIKGEAAIRSVHVYRYLPSDVSIVFDENIIEKGIEFVVGTDPNKETYTEEAVIGDNYCRHIPITTKNKYGYFKVDDSVVKSTDNKITFEITYFDSGTSPLRLQYNSAESDYEKTEITKTNTNSWLTRSFTVSNAAFDNKQNNSADFRIVGDTYIRRVAIKNASINTAAVHHNMKQNQSCKVQYFQGKLKVSVSEEMLHADVSVYNLTGQLMYKNKMNNTEESFNLNPGSNFSIVVLQKGSKLISRKILTE